MIFHLRPEGQKEANPGKIGRKTFQEEGTI
jgi:hypothetical protein